MFNFINSVAAIVTFLIIWFKTNAFVEYISLFYNKGVIHEYNNTLTNLTFPQYLFTNKEKITTNKFLLFFIKVITCPICLNTWLCIIVSCIALHIIFIPILYISTLLIYFLFDRLLN